jgi:FtsH-binding integral membrane protein
MLHATHRLLLVAFLGALALFATTVTPALFATVPPSAAARVVGRVLPVLDATGLLLGLVAVLLGATGRSGRAAVVLGLALAALAGCSLFLVTPEIASIRRATGDALSQLPAGDPSRRRFGMLHGASTVLFGLQALLAVALVALRPEARAARRR